MDASRVNTIKGRSPLRASAKIREALAQRGKGVGSISYAYSPKTHRDVVLSSDLELCHFISLEGRGDVESYDLDTDRIIAHLVGEGYVGSKPDAVITLRTGQRCLAEVKYQSDVANDLRASLQFQAQEKEAKRIGADWYVYTEEQAAAEELFLHDWLHIITTLSASVDTLYKSLEKRVVAAVKETRIMTLGDFHARNFAPWNVVFSCVFQLCQRGQLTDNLREKPLSWSTEIGLGSWE
ncbi:MAG: hypothetical protein WBJ19_00375 [Rhodoferax sp.]